MRRFEMSSMIDCDLQALSDFYLNVGNFKAITSSDTSVTLLNQLWCPLRMFAKTDVNGNKTHPLYTYLKPNAPGVLSSEAIKWNFTNRNGQIVKRYAPSTKPEAIAAEIEKLL